MVSKIRAYEGQGITVQYEIKRCIHAEKCVHGLTAVFNPQERPWIQPQNAAADEIDVLHLLEILADVDRIAEHLSVCNNWKEQER